MDTEKEITVHDLARISGYSVATISRSLNDSPLVKEETKQKILKLAADYHFELNASAKGLATSKVDTIGVILPPEYDKFGQQLYYSSLVSDLRGILEQADYDLIVTFSTNRFTGKSNILSLVNRKKVDGLIILRESVELTLEFYKKGLITLYDKVGIFLVLIGIVILLSTLTENFLTFFNIINVIRQISYIALIALGVTNIIITTGIDLSSGSIVGLTSVVVASAAHPGQFPLIVTLLIGLSVGAVIGLINGTLIAKAGIPPFIVTLGAYTSVRGLALLYSGGRPVNVLKKEFTFLGAGVVGGIPVPIIILVVVAILSHIMLTSTRFGRHIFAIGGNEQAAIISGINVDRVKILVYVYASFLASLGGIILTGRISSGQSQLGVGFELDAIASAVIGGTSLSGGMGSVFGTLSGALVIGVINNGMDLLNVSMYWQQIVKGVIIVLAVFLDTRKHKAK